ncbi:EH signature domain-containing protein [Acinetobacter johnsonii]|uniref:EH signature domain-containing protein n=1 Tax=Acinetobacter johnsonii TaxID=40214 RepID=A0AA42XGU8_ACIJO|nr:EH signature domain-containing protein [Acinetobacter johnsonii]MDH2171826.1 EH signature domain-containing protein [Acinetobacter johnsonii]MDH2177217.1 EH signature domain-containing protein [Acinetobacter johnsonii]
MSIANLKRRIEERISVFSEPTHIQTKFVRPQRLMKTLSIIEHKFDDLENVQPLEEKIIKSVLKLEQHGFDGLTKRDLKNLAWSLSKKLHNYEEKLLFTPVGVRLIDYFKQLGIDQLQFVYFPLLYSYFSFQAKELEKQPDSWVQLRNILNTNKSLVFKNSTRRKRWMTTLIDNSEVLTTEPTKKFVREFLQDSNDNTVAYELESLRISANSWFWDDLIRSAIKSIKTMNEDEYLQNIPRFLVLLEKNKIYTTTILAALLERYASTSQREKAHEVLKHLALDQWGNPQYESLAGWNNVNADTKKMVIQWFVRADLEAFFKLFSRTADVNRFNYWIKFIDQISFSQIFLGPEALYSQRHEHMSFRHLNRGRLKELIGSTPSNNAFLLKIDNVYVIDFSDTGNACFLFNILPYKEISPKIHVRDLKNYTHKGYIDKLGHIGSWGERFDQRLAEIGIFANLRETNKYSSINRKNY